MRADDASPPVNVTGAEILALNMQQKIEDDLAARGARCNGLRPRRAGNARQLGAAAGHDSLRAAGGGDLLRG